MTSTIPARGSIQDFLFGEETERALRIAGMTSDLRQALIDDPQGVGGAAVAEMRRFIRHTADADAARLRSETMAIKLADTTLLTARVRNLLRRRGGVATIGDLCMLTLSSLDSIHQMGPKGVLEIMQMLAVNGLDLLGEQEDALRHAITLYGHAEFVPSRYMPFWERHLDGRTRDILARFATLRDLSTLSAHEFMHREYGYRDGELLSTPKNQMFHVCSGLSKAGLAFRDE